MACEPVGDGGGLDASVRETGVREVATGEGTGHGVALDADDVSEAACEREREETDAAVEVERRAAGDGANTFVRVAETLTDERVEERVVDLEEAGGVETVRLAGDASHELARVRVVERRREADAVVPSDGLKLVGVRGKRPGARGGSKLREFRFDDGGGDGTFDHVADPVRAALEIAEGAVRAVVLPLRARAIAPLLRRGCDGNLARVCDAGDAA